MVGHPPEGVRRQFLDLGRGEEVAVARAQAWACAPHVVGPLVCHQWRYQTVPRGLVTLLMLRIDSLLCGLGYIVRQFLKRCLSAVCPELLFISTFLVLLIETPSERALSPFLKNPRTCPGPIG